MSLVKKFVKINNGLFLYTNGGVDSIGNATEPEIMNVEELRIGHFECSLAKSC